MDDMNSENDISEKSQKTAAYSNRILAAAVRALFPGVEEIGLIAVEAHGLGFSPETLPILYPYEQFVLAAVTRWRAPRAVLEIGTGQGRSTRVLAANSPANALVVTVDLPSEARGEYSRSCLHGDVEVGRRFANDAANGAQIHQILCDSRQLNPAALREAYGEMDLIVVDGDHGYDAVRADTELALALAGPNTIILWHDFYTFPDYLAEGSAKRGVYPALNELADTGRIALRHIIGTYYVAGCGAWTPETPGTPTGAETPAGPFGQGIVRLAASMGTIGAGNREGE